MPTALLSTKTFIPQPRPNLVTRPRLLKKLADGLTHPLTLVSAPPGFGKTTLIAEWLAWVKSGKLHSEDQETHQPANLPGIAFGWLSLDEGDNDPARFFSYLFSTVQKIDPGLGQEGLPVPGSPQIPPVETLVTSLINDLAEMGKQTILVLDDVYLIRNEIIHQALNFLVSHEPANFHLVLVTREDPPLPLPMLRARGQMVEIREADLRFSPEEAATFLNQTMGLALTQEAASSLTGRTEGWIAGLQMAALALRALVSNQEQGKVEEFIADFRGDDRYVMDYLMEEVYCRQPEEIQDFLLQTAFLDRLSPALCDFVMGGSPAESRNLEPELRSGPLPSRSSRPILEHLERANLFLIPLDHKREWYRYHPLFADLLRYRARREQPEWLAEAHRRASHWFAQAGDADEAMKHALAAPDYPLAANLAEEYMLSMIGSSRIITYLEWIQRIPEEIISSRAYLCAGCGWAYAITGQTDRARHLVEMGEAALPHYERVYSLPKGRWIHSEETRGHLMAIRAYTDRLRGNFSSAIEHSRQALEVLPETALEARSVVALNLGLLHKEQGEMEFARQALSESVDTALTSGENLYAAISALCILGGIATMQGKLNDAANDYHRAIHLGTARPGQAILFPAVGYAYGGLVGVYTQRNEIAEAEKYLEKAFPLVQQIGQEESIAMAHLYRGLLFQLQGDFRSAEDWLQKAEDILQAHPMREGIRTEWIAIRGQFFLAQGDPGGAARWLQAHGVQGAEPGSQDGSPRLRIDQLSGEGIPLAESLIWGRVALALGEFERAAKLLERTCTLAEASQNDAILLEGLIFQAVVYSQRGNSPRAAALFEEALKMAAPEGNMRPFLNAGEPLEKLLRQAILRGITLAFTQKLLSEWKEQERRQLTGRDPSTRVSGAALLSTSLAEPLTEREKQVLRLLAAGLSSSEAAEELVISVSTARSYIKSIYSKLDAHSREEAIEKGRQARAL